ncbi:kinase-like domain-containing protein [Rhizophagus irregularis DAOM 181602=DAOM 197198]|nr:kinase-like domain-containing protein [Rhizophagus irregularis DAOM 181602=DAOM 197198]
MSLILPEEALVKFIQPLDNSSDISTDFLNEIKSYLQIYILHVVNCYGITQDPNTKNYMMVLYYCENGNLRNYNFNSYNHMKLYDLSKIADGLLDIHNAGKVHKDFHSGNILEEPVNSSDLTSFQVNSVSECFDVQLSESDLDEINQEEDNLNDEI